MTALPPFLRHLLVLAAVAVILSGVALWNGYPLIYFDTEDYVNMSFTWELVLWRTMPYALVTWLGKAAGSLWAVVILQALVTAWVLHETVFAFFSQHRFRWLLGLTLALLVLTSLPWYVGQVIADVFSGLVILAAAVLAYGEHLPRWRRLLLVPILALGVMVHMSHVAVAAGLVLVLWGMWLGHILLRFIPRPAVGLASLGIMLGVVAVPLVHWGATGRAFFSASGHVLQLALFVQHGLVERYLEEVCPQGKKLKLCRYEDDLPETADEFLWAPWSFPFNKLGGWKGMMGEAEVIVAGVLARYPEEVFGHSFTAAIDQMIEIELGEGLGPKTKDNWAGEFVSTVKARFPAEADDYLGAVQNRGEGFNFVRINNIQVPLSVILLATSIAGGLLALRRNDPRMAGFAFTVLIGMFGNALVCGALSNPHDRYQNRLAWLPLIVVAAALARPQPLAGRQRTSRSTSAEGSAPNSQDAT